ncbi:cyclic di-GMP phosphodiesterase Gmr [mine drainage metagenome]|uniref:Cyclic di-GMP phosphodiesterase Gmr n=1 Tax=mine drainage metagenome TaxID=410659 RepID=A0A1J5QTV6_9ZZZZ
MTMGLMKIGTRLTVSFAVLLCLLIAVSTVSLSRFDGLAAVTRTIVEVQVRRAFLAQEANLHAQAAANSLLKLLQTPDRERRVRLYAQMDAELASSDAAVTEVAKTLLSGQDKAQLERLNAVRKNYGDRFRETVEMIELDGPVSARNHFDASTQKALGALLKETSALAATQRERMSADLEQLKDAETSAQHIVILLTLSALMAGAALAWLMTRSIVGPVGAAVGVAEAIARGDLDKAVPAGKGDEVGKLLRALEVMRDSIFTREAKLNRLAYEDALTGLPNRTSFLETFERLPAERAGAVVVLDIDRFALINNALGHDIGDRLLGEIGRRLMKMDGRQMLVARLWGNEFAFLLEGADRMEAIGFVDTILALLRNPISLDGQRLDVSGTLGIAFYADEAAEGAAVLRKATLAMRSAKKRRVSYAFGDEVDHQPAHEHLTLIGEMREALSRNEFVVYYQPKLNLALNRVTGAEALLRWQHPQKGLIPPSRFIPFAEQTGFIREITPWLLELVIRHAAEWHRDGLQVVPSVNLSTYDLLNPDLVAYIRRLLEKYELPADCLCLEITESALMEEPELALMHLNELSGLGVKLSIDDYGSGQASLAYLKMLPVNELKIDRVFVSDVAKTPKNAAIVRSTIILCHELALSVVAEGAETAEEFAWLKENNSDMVQGYVVAKPMPLDAFLARVSKPEIDAHPA